MFRVIILNLTFRDVSSQLWHLEPSSLLNYDVQSCSSQFDVQRCQFLNYNLQSLHLLQFGIQSHCAYSFRHFELPHFLFFGVQSHFSSSLLFRVIAHSIYIHWHCTSCLHDFTFIFIFLTSLPCAYRLFIMLFWTSPSPTHDIVLWVHDSYFGHVVGHPTLSVLM